MKIEELDSDKLKEINGGGLIKLLGKIHGAIVGAIKEGAEIIIENTNPDITTLKQ